MVHKPAPQHSPRFLVLAEEARQQIQEISNEQVKAKQDQGEMLALIDVREDHEWHAGHVPGAVHLGRGILERDIEQRFPDVDQQIILYCGGGYRSALAAVNLQKMGYRNILSMMGGFRGWVQAGHPVTTSKT